MSFLQSLILGIVQGLTEFLPVSSSAHLVLVPYLLNWKIPESQIFPFDVLVQLGTLAAVIIYFRKDLWNIIRAFVKGIAQRKPFADEESCLGWYLILATIPAGLAGVFLKERVEAAFNNPRLTAYFLFVTAVLLVAAEFFGRRTRQLGSIKWHDALWIGAFQAFAIFPGISRSGATITGGMTRHLERPAAARFSFLMSIPIMLAAGVFSLPDLFGVPNLTAFLPVLSVGFITAGVVGYLAIHWLISFLSKRSLFYFAAYCVLFGSAVLITLGIRQTSQPVASPPMVEEILLVDLSPSLEWLRPQLADCAEAAGLALATGDSTGVPSAQRLALRWGQPEALTGSAFILGEDELAFIANPQNTLVSLPVTLLRDIASGKITNWAQVFESCPDCFSAPPAEDLLASSIRLLVYAPGDDTRAVFENAVMAGSPLMDSGAYLLPSPAALSQLVGTTPNAFGFLPARGADKMTRNISVQDESGAPLPTRQPILAILSTEPAGATARWLACLQRSIVN